MTERENINLHGLPQLVSLSNDKEKHIISHHGINFFMKVHLPHGLSDEKEKRFGPS